MKACLDVDYRDPNALAACCLFSDWADEESYRDVTAWISGVAPYVPGEFYKRELPCLLAVLRAVSEPLDLILVDSYVWLQDEEHPGMGAHLYQALGGQVPVIGVAKTRYFSAGTAQEIVRGTGHSPLYVSAAGVPVDQAATWVLAMHGASRVPTLLRRVDHLARQTPSPASETGRSENVY
jgi:deoxyribonuclease V